MNTRIKNMLARVGSAQRPGFTLIELLIAVGALAFIAAGVAAIFDATGRTITAGKRVSAFGQYASLIERQMRADFESMTRDGFLVIRNEMADANGDDIIDPTADTVPLFDGDTRPRARRIDEIMFFSKGQFTSAREALHPEATARSDSARIYYGIGKRMRPQSPPGSFNPGDAYITPRLNDSNNDPNGALGYQGPTGNIANPNKFASEWILLRHVTLLCAPESTVGFLPNTPMLSGYGRNVLRDSETQVGLQPAAPTIFRALNAIFPTGAPANVIRTDGARLSFTSGLIDIATTTLPEIRSIVMTADTDPNGANPAGPQFFDPAQNAGPDGSNAGPDGVYRRSPLDPNIIGRSQAWMSDALPGWTTANSTMQRTRIRCEPTATNYVGSITDATGPWSADLAAAIRRADQLMLSSSNFLPRCTEFIVEWSFGDTWTSDPGNSNYVAERAGEVVWHGMERWVNNRIVTQFYLYNQYPWNVQPPVSYKRINGSTGTYLAGGSTNPVELIHGQGFSIPGQVGDPGSALTSYFGYIDPTFNPDANGDGKLESATDAASPTIPWVWPKLIRVTLSLADPADPSIEQTFQFVFEVPAPAGQ